MDSELLFFIVFILFALVQGLGQKKRQEQRRRQAGQLPPSPMPPPGREEGAEGRRTGGDAGAVGGTAGRSKTAAGEGTRTSEGLIPSEVWEEILGLARGQRPPPRGRPVARAEEAGGAVPPSVATEPAGPGTPPRPIEAEVEGPRELRSRTLPGRRAGRPGGGAAIEAGRPRARSESRPRAAPAMPGGGRSGLPGVPPSQELQRPARPPSRRKGDIGPRPRAVIGVGSVEDLRKAIVLKEVLGPPLALRDEEG